MIEQSHHRRNYSRGGLRHLPGTSQSVDSRAQTQSQALLMPMPALEPPGPTPAPWGLCVLSHLFETFTWLVSRLRAPSPWERPGWKVRQTEVRDFHFRDRRLIVLRFCFYFCFFQKMFWTMIIGSRLFLHRNLGFVFVWLLCLGIN